jgi:PAS domain S-box-containing protein
MNKPPNDSETWLSAFLDALAFGVVVQNAKGAFTRANKAATEILGMTLEELAGSTPADPRWRIVDEDGKPCPPEAYPVSRARLSGEPVRGVVQSVYSGTERERWILTDAVPIKDPKTGEVNEAVVSFVDITERKRVERALQDNEARLALALDAARMGVWDWDIAAGKVVWSEALERLYGLAPGSFDGRYETYLALIHPEDRKAIQDAIGQALESDIDYYIEHRVVRSDGALHWIAGHGDVIRDGAGKPVRMSGVAMDITARKMMEEELRYQNQLNKTITDNAASCLFMMDGRGHPTFMNPAAEAVTGYTLAEIENRPLHYAIHHSHPDGTPYPIERCPIDRASAELRPIKDHEDVFVRKDGSFFPVVCHVAPLEQKGVTVGAVLEFRDVTAAKKAENALRESEARFRAMADTAPMLIWMSGPDKGRIYLNKVWLDFTGRTLEDELGEGWAENVHPDDYAFCLDGYASAFEARRPLEMEYRLRRADGEYRWIFDRAAPRFAPDGSFLGHIGSCIDVTERRRVGEELAARVRQQAAVAELGQRALSGALLQELFDEAVRSVAHTLEADYCKVLELLPSGSELLLCAGIGWHDGLVGRATVGTGLESQAGYILAAPAPVIVENLASERRFSGPKLLHDHGVISGMSVVIEGGEKPFGVLGVHSKSLRAFSQNDIAFLQSVAHILSTAVRRQRAEEERLELLNGEMRARLAAEEVMGRLSFLSKASELLASSLDYETTLANVASLAIEVLADWCAIDLLEEGSLKRVALVHEDPRLLELAREIMKRYPPDPNASQGAYAAMRAGQAALYRDIPESVLKAAARDPEHLDMLRAFGMRSAIVAPLVVRGQAIGALTLVLAESDKRFDDADLALAAELARRAAVAVDNARLFSSARDASEELEKRVSLRTQQLERINKELESFAYAVSHDLRTPLSGIDGFTQALLEDYGDTLDETAGYYLERIQHNARRMGQLIDDILRLSRVSRKEVQLERVDLGALVNDIVSSLQQRQPFRRVEVTVAEGVLVEGDASLLRAALENLLDNAWKFTSQRDCARIEFGLTQQGGETVYFVRDDGAGFDMSYAHHLFQPFHRLHSDAAFQGTGIGLVTVKRIIERHGGRIRAEAEPDKGASFFFTLNAAKVIDHALG